MRCLIHPGRGRAAWATETLLLASPLAATTVHMCVGAPGMLLLELPESVLNWGEFASANNVKGWLDASVPLCQWSGVQCDGDGRVTALCAPPAARCAAH